MKTRSKSELKALSSAYEICTIMDDHCGQVIASGDPCETDVENRRLAKLFIKFYEKNIITKGHDKQK